jgi:uncharacterized protein YjlB
MSASTPNGSTSDKQPEVIAHLLEPRGEFPNNTRLPVLLYRGAFKLPGHGDAARVIERAFERNGWSAGWRDGVYNYHHYHSTAHEVLGCYAGRASVQVGGPDGPVLEFGRGDALVLPAGAAHKSLETSKDFSVVGSYADGRPVDMKRGREGERPDAEQRIAEVPIPKTDPVYGDKGPLAQHSTDGRGD